MAPRLRLDNRTGWSTHDLRAWLVRGLAFLGARPDKHVLCVHKRRGSRRLGFASYGTPGVHEATYIRLCLPRVPEPGALWDAETATMYAKVLAHEVDHNLGLRHAEMGGCYVTDVPDSRAAWALDRPVCAAAVPRPRDRQAEALAKAEAALARWTRKQALAKTKVAKYRRAVARCSRRLEASKQTAPVRAPDA